MSSMVDDVKQAIWLHRIRVEVGEPIDGTTVQDIHPIHQWQGTAEAAIAAATPHLRRQFRDELFAELIAEADPFDDDHVIGYREDGSNIYGSFQDWLHARKEQDDAQ